MSISENCGFVNDDVGGPQTALDQQVISSEHGIFDDPGYDVLYHMREGCQPAERPKAPSKSLTERDTVSITPDGAQITPLIDRLIMVASGHPGEFLISTVGSENPETGAALDNYHCHASNDEVGRRRVYKAINVIATGAGEKRGFNVYVGMALMKPGLSRDQKGTEDDVVGVLAAVLDFDGKHDPATRHTRLPSPAHAEVETSPGNFQCWYFFDKPYPVAEAKPVLTALARATGTDHTQSCEHLFRVPGTLNWPTRKKIASGRSSVPWRVRLTIKPKPPAHGISLADLKTAILAKYPNAFDKLATAAGVDFDWDTPLKPGAPRELDRKRIIEKLRAPPGGDRSAIAYGVLRELANRRYTPAQARDKLAELQDTAEALGHYHDSPKGFEAALKADIYRIFTKPFEDRPDPANVFNAYIDRYQQSKSVVLPNGGSVPGSEIDLAYFFADRFHNRLRHVPDWGWLSYDGKRWQRDKVYTAWDLARGVANSFAAANLASDAVRKKIASRGTVSAIVELARSDQRIVATPDQWDHDPILLNTQSGIVDLTTTRLRDHQPDAMLTKITSTGLGDSRECSLWLKFLDRVTGTNPALQTYLQRVAGYCLTGSIKEHALFFLYGTGANGKGVFLNTLTAIFGDYAKVAPVDMFTATQGERHPTDMAMLQGARLVAAQETEEGRSWAESKIKSLTGGDPITARFMRQDFFTYSPQFKLVIAGNHKPRFANVDEAIRRRVQLIPFTVTIPPAQRDKDLADKLRDEHAAILAWAVDGCREWQRIGLAPPDAVQASTEEYFAEEDRLTGWIEDGWELDPLAWASSAELYASFKAYTERAGERPMTQRMFSERLVAAGLQRGKEGKARTRGFFGLRRLGP